MTIDLEFTCRAFPFIVTHPCNNNSCQQTRSLIVLRNPSNHAVDDQGEPQAFDERVLDYPEPLDCYLDGEDPNLLEVVLNTAQDAELNFEIRNHRFATICSHPECNAGHFQGPIFRFLQTQWGSENVESLDPIVFTTNRNILATPRIGGFFNRSQQDRFDVRGLATNIFDSNLEAEFYDLIAARLIPNGFSIATHVRPKDLLNPFQPDDPPRYFGLPSNHETNRESLQDTDLDVTIYDGRENEDTGESYDAYDLFFDTSYDFVICLVREVHGNIIHTPLVIVEFDGYGGLIQPDQNEDMVYHLPRWTLLPAFQQERRIAKMNQKIRWAYDANIPLVVVNAHLSYRAGGQQPGSEYQRSAVIATTVAELMVMRAIEYKALFDDDVNLLIDNLRQAYPLYEIMSAMERTGQEVTFSPAGYEQLAAEHVAEILESTPDRIPIPYRILDAANEGLVMNLERLHYQLVIDGDPYTGLAYPLRLYHSQSQTEFEGIEVLLALQQCLMRVTEDHWNMILEIVEEASVSPSYEGNLNFQPPTRTNEEE